MTMSSSQAESAGRPLQPVDAVVLGEALVDLFPDAPGEPLWDVERFVRHLGGAGANLAVGLSRLGVRVALSGLVGGDAFGRFVRERLQAEGVAIDGLRSHRSARTGVVFVALPEGGNALGDSRTFLPYRQPSADLLLSEGDLTGPRGRLLCLSSMTMLRDAARRATERAAVLARRAGALLACDLNLRPHLWDDPREAPPLLRRLLGGCDIVKLARPELPLLFGTEDPEDAAARARALGPKIVVVTLGAEGCVLDCDKGSARLLGERVTAVDKTGAGDAFFAGLCAELLGALPPPSAGEAPPLPDQLAALPFDVLKRACARGNTLGARVCTALGATTAFPRRPATPLGRR